MVVYNGYGWRVTFDHSFLHTARPAEVGHNEPHQWSTLKRVWLLTTEKSLSSSLEFIIFRKVSCSVFI